MVFVWASLSLGRRYLEFPLIRDNLSLNVVMLVWPIEAVKAWQSIH